MQLTEKYSIEKESHGISLVEQISVRIKKDGKFTDEVKKGEKKHYYGTLYQALRGFVDRYLEDDITDIYDIGLQVSALTMDIEFLKDDIKREFCTEVKKG